MARVPRLKKTILPVLTDPSAIGRAAQVDPSAGALASGIGQAAQVGVDILQQREAEEKRIRDLQEQTDMTRRTADYQNKAFEVIKTNRDSFKATPDKSFDSLNDSLRKLGDTYLQDLSPENTERLRNTQEAVIGRFGLQQRQWAVTQTTANTNSNIKATGASYLESAALAGKESDFQRLNDISQDVSALSLRAGETFDAKSVKAFSDNLERGIVENFTDGLMFHNPDMFLQKLNEGFFDNVLSGKEKAKKKDEVQKHIVKLTEQAKFDSQMNFLSGNADIMTAFKAGEIDLNSIDDLIAASNISPEAGEQARELALKGPVLAETKVVTFTDLWTEKELIFSNAKKGKTIINKKELDDAVRLQTKTMEKLNAGEITAGEAKGIMKSLELGMINRIGITPGSATEDHYTTAFDIFQEYADDVNVQIELFRSYVQQADKVKIDDIGDNKRERQLANGIAKLTIRQATEKIAPAVATMEEMPNNIINSRGTQVYTGAQTETPKPDVSVQGKFKIMTRPDGSVWRVFPNGTGQRIK